MKRLYIRVQVRLNTPCPYVIVFATFLLFLEAVASCFFSMKPRRKTDLEDVYRWTLRRSSMWMYSRCTRPKSHFSAHRGNEMSHWSMKSTSRSIVHLHIVFLKFSNLRLFQWIINNMTERRCNAFYFLLNWRWHFISSVRVWASQRMQRARPESEANGISWPKT